MPGNDYHFLTRWRVESTRDEVYAILENTRDVARWWPSVYPGVEVEEPGDADGLGKVIRLCTKGWLPYTLRWRCRVTEKRPPERFALEARGDFHGRGVWTFEPAPVWGGRPRAASSRPPRAERGECRSWGDTLGPQPH